MLRTHFPAGSRRTALFLPAVILAALLLAALAACSNTDASGGRYVSHRDGKPSPVLKDASVQLRADGMTDAGFASHLPLLVLEAQGENQGVQNALLRVIDSPSGLNTLQSLDANGTAVLLTRMEGEPFGDGKARYKVRLAPEAGNAKQSLFGLPEDDAWLLVGSSSDRGMLRNYLALTLGGSILPDATPEARYCEVLLTTEDGFRYEGLFLLSETLEHRLGLADGQGGFLLQYKPGDKLHPDGRAIEGQDPTLSGFRQVYPPINASGAIEESIAGNLLEVERTLYSDDMDVYYDYPSMLDAASFADTYILNNFLMNFHADGVPVSLYGTEGGKLRLVPVWNFDEAVDNTLAPLEPEQAVADKTLWISRLFRDPEFIVKTYRQRYYQLYRTVLEPRNVNALVDDIAAYLGPALLRDWQRWESLYTDDERFVPAAFVTASGPAIVRQTYAPEQELVKIRHLLRSHDIETRERILEMRWQKDLLDSSGRVKHNMLLAGLFIVIFFGVVVYARSRV